MKTRHFHRWAKKAGLLDKALLSAVSEMIKGLIDADLGGGVLKKKGLHCQEKGRVVVLGLFWPQIEMIGGSLFPGLRRMSEPIF
jgi:hypothetical protein